MAIRNYLSFNDASVSQAAEVWRQRAPRRSRYLQRHAVTVTATAVLPILLASPSAADAIVDLRSGTDSAHAAAGCPSYQPDPALDEVAQRNTAETDAYLLHTARFAPFENDLNIPLMQILRDRNYQASKAHLLVGYGQNEADSIRALLLQGSERLTDCTYTKYGVNVLTNDSAGYVLTAVILAAP